MEFYVWVTGYYCVINIIAAACYFVDKRKALAGVRRIPEKTLILLAGLGGGAGAFLAMHIFRHKTKKKKFQIWVPVWLLFHVFLIVFVTFQNNHLRVSRYTYVTAGTRCRVVQVSDLHNAYMWYDSGYIADAIEKEKPDIIVITGDIADSNHTDIKKALVQARLFSEIADTYYVTGNHEYMLSETERRELFDGLRDAGITVLDNEYVMIEGFGEPFALLGLDDRALSGDTLRELVRKVETEQGDCVRVLLSHEPQYISDYGEARIDLVLAGHAHGGQIVLPLLGALVAPGQGFFPKYVHGEYFAGNTRMIVSAGIGNSILPIRLFDYPELVVVDFVKGT